MKHFKKRISALALSVIFASMQISMASIDTGLGVGNGGAVIDHTTGGYAGMETGVNSATLNFNADTHVNWNTLNVNSNETLNFNAVNGANDLTVINTVNQGMSYIYGNINANLGQHGQLIISNPNGVLFDGAKFTTAGDVGINADPAFYNPSFVDAVVSGQQPPIAGLQPGYNNYPPNGSYYAVKIKDSDFSVGGELNVIAPTMNVVNSTFNTKNGTGDVRFTTTNGQDYFVTSSGCNSCNTEYTETQSMRMEAIKVDGDVYITSDKGNVKFVNGGEINGNLNIQSDGSVSLNYVQMKDNVPIKTVDRLHVTGDTTVVGNGDMMYAREADFDGDLNMTNKGGFLEVNNINVGKLVTNEDGSVTRTKSNMTLTTTGDSENPQATSKVGYKRFIHVNNNTNVGGDAIINSQNNIHIGNYTVKDKIYKDDAQTKFYYDGTLLPGEFNVGGDLTAKTNSGHITTTIDVNVGNNVSFDANATNNGTRSFGGNILADPDSVITAKTYQFKSDGYIGALKGFEQEAYGKTFNYTTDQAVINTMEDYTFIPADTPSAHDYLTVGGGTITKIETPKFTENGNPVQVYIKSTKDVTLNGANAGDINITAPQSKITVTGDVHARNVNVGPETDYLKLDFEGRDFTTNYTNIRDEKVVTIRPDEEITYDLADGGYNRPTLKPGEKTTYLIGPDQNKPDVPNDDNVRVKNWVPDDPTKPLVSTPVAFAADLDDEEEAGVRKNVDGSVTVVRAYPMPGSADYQ